MRNQGLNSGGFRGSEFQQANEAQDDNQPIALYTDAYRL